VIRGDLARGLADGPMADYDGTTWSSSKWKDESVELAGTLVNFCRVCRLYGKPRAVYAAE